MYLRVPLYKYKLYSTYGYLHTSISSVTPTRDPNKYKSAISTSICYVTPTRDMNKYKSAMTTSMCINLLYEFMINSDICYCISIIVICLL